MIDNPFFYHNYPYTNNHELNTDYLYYRIRALADEIKNFEVANNIEYAGEWDISKAYEKYSIVYDSTTNLGYIAIQPVPAGINITNTEYWSEVANFTAQIANIGNRVTNLETEVAQIKPVKHRIDNTSKCLLVGNSYAYGSGGSGYSGWAYQFENITGCNATIIQQRGGDFCQPATNTAPLPTYPNCTYRQAISSLILTLTQEERESYDFIIFGGGYNDGAFGFSVSDIVTEITQTVALCKTNFPNAEIVIIPLLSTTRYFAGGGIADANYRNTINGWTKGAIENGCLTSTHTSDWFYGKSEYQGANNSNIHLNDAGYIMCAKYILAIIDGWDGSIFTDYSSEITASQYVTENSYIVGTKRDNTCYLQAHIKINGNATGNPPSNMVNVPLFTLPTEMYDHYYTSEIYAWINTTGYRGLYACRVVASTGEVVIANNYSTVTITIPKNSFSTGVPSADKTYTDSIHDLPTTSDIEIYLTGTYQIL